MAPGASVRSHFAGMQQLQARSGSRLQLHSEEAPQDSDRPHIVAVCSRSCTCQCICVKRRILRCFRGHTWGEIQHWHLDR